MNLKECLAAVEQIVRALDPVRAYLKVKRPDDDWAIDEADEMARSVEKLAKHLRTELAASEEDGGDHG